MPQTLTGITNFTKLKQLFNNQTHSAIL